MRKVAKKTISRVMAQLASRKTNKKSASSRANGKLGGAPVKNHDPASVLRRFKYAQKKLQNK